MSTAALRAQLAVAEDLVERLKFLDKATYQRFRDAFEYAESIVPSWAKVLDGADCLMVVFHGFALIIRFHHKKERFYVSGFFHDDGNSPSPGASARDTAAGQSLTEHVVKALGLKGEAAADNVSPEDEIVTLEDEESAASETTEMADNEFRLVLHGYYRSIREASRGEISVLMDANGGIALDFTGGQERSAARRLGELFRGRGTFWIRSAFSRERGIAMVSAVDAATRSGDRDADLGIYSRFDYLNRFKHLLCNTSWIGTEGARVGATDSHPANRSVSTPRSLPPREALLALAGDMPDFK